MKYIYLVFTLFILQSTFSQNLDGYYITDKNVRIEGQFKPAEFLDPAESLQFSPANTATFSALNLGHVLEYGINGAYKFVRANVDVDTSTDLTNSLSVNKEPVFVNKPLFLNVLIEGDASLYSYRSESGVKYFYSLKGFNEIKQLVYKKYRYGDEKVGENMMYRQQLYNVLLCSAMTMKDFERLDYDKKDFIPVFEKYNNCKGNKEQSFKNNTGKQVAIKYTVFAAVNSVTMKVSYVSPAPDNITKVSPGFGGEVSLITAKERLAFFLRADYEHFKGLSQVEQVNPTFRYTDMYTLKYSMMNFDFGVRYNVIMMGQNKVYAEAGWGFAKSMGTLKEQSHANDLPPADGFKTDLRNTAFFNLGIGYVYKQKYGIALGFDSNKGLLDNYASRLTLNTSKLSLNLRYTLN